MMVCSKEVYPWFGNLDPVNRINVMCGLINMCNPFELRFFATFVERTARRDFVFLREAELQANNVDVVSKLVNLNDSVVRNKLIISLALLHSCQVSSSNVIFKTLSGLDDPKTKRTGTEPENIQFIRDMLLILTLASHHPSFSFNQRTVVQSQLTEMSKLSSDSAINLEEKECSKNHHHWSPVNIPLQIYSTYRRNFVRNLELIGMQWKRAYRISVNFTSGEITQVLKTQQELYEFHTKLVQLISSDAPDNNSKWCTNIPQFPGPSVTKFNEEISEDMFQLMGNYLLELIQFLCSNTAGCDYATNFFTEQSQESNQDSSSCKSSRLLSTENPKPAPTVPLPSTLVPPPPIETTPVDPISTPVVPKSSADSPVATTINPKINQVFPLDTVISHSNVISTPVSCALKPPKGSANCNYNTHPQNPMNANNSTNCSKLDSQAKSFCSSSSSSPYSSPTASVTNSRSTSPRNKAFHASLNSNPTIVDSRRNAELILFAEELKKEKLFKYFDVLKDYGMNQLKSMNSENFRPLNIKNANVIKVRKIAEKLSNLNGIKVGPAIPLMYAADMVTKVPEFNTYASGQQAPKSCPNQEINTRTSQSNFVINSAPLNQFGSTSSCIKTSCVVTPSHHPPDLSILINSAPRSRIEALHNQTVPKSSTSSNVVTRTQVFHGSVKSGSHDSSSSLSDSSSSPPSPASDTVFLNNNHDHKHVFDIAEGYLMNRPYHTVPAMAKSNRHVTSSTNSELNSPVLNCPPKMPPVQHMGIPLEGSHLPRPNIRPPPAVPNMMFRSPAPMGPTMVQNGAKVILNNSHPISGYNLPIHSHNHDSKSQFQVRAQHPFSNETSNVIKPSEGEPKMGSLPPSTFVLNHPPISVASRNQKYRQNNKFSKSGSVGRDKDEESQVSPPATSIVVKTTVSRGMPSTSPMTQIPRVTCSNSSPPPSQSTNQSVPLTFLPPGIGPPVYYPYPPHNFMAPNSGRNGSISPNMHPGFNFIGNPNQLPNGMSLPDQIRYPSQRSFGAMPQHHQAQTNQPNGTPIVGNHQPFFTYHGNYLMPNCGGISGKPPSCYNCGNVGHQGPSCKETTMEEMSKNSQYRICYTPRQKDSDTPNDLKS